MKALILAAGFGTRLLPYSRMMPKPLFTLNQRPILALTIARLERAGFDTIIINTHHGHDKIEGFLAGNTHRSQVVIRHEPEILGTGGAIRNVADLWRDGPLLVINADIITDIDPAEVFQFHGRHGYPVTMVMHHHEQHNSVAVTKEGFVTAFTAADGKSASHSVMAFTGIHVLDPDVLAYIPPTGAVHIIDVYQSMLQAGKKIKVREARHHYWQDIGTPETYRAAAMDYMAPMAFKKAFGSLPCPPTYDPLQGDGSDRRWFRLTAGHQRLIMADHGLRREHGRTQEVDAFVAIGRHLHAKGAAVPRIYLYDGFSGLVFLEDLGDCHLQSHVQEMDRPELVKVYRHVIDQWLHLALAGYEGFDPAWTHQSKRYDRQMILEKECRYFVQAFVRDYLGLDLAFEELAEDFHTLADHILAAGRTGFMHRDLQSRNIMMTNGQAYFIDFQGGRPGPLQYDLASLLIDPYVSLPQHLQDELKDYAAKAFARRTGSSESLLHGYDGCALSRNMQILGAFAYLSRVKGKHSFKNHIPRAVKTLHRRLINPRGLSLPKLRSAVETIVEKLDRK